MFEDVCYFCGDSSVADNDDIRELRKEFGIVRPICQKCLDKGEKPVTRNANNIRKKQKK